MTTFEGYHRSSATELQLISAVEEVICAYPTQRLGQILVNYVITGDLSDFFNLKDEEMIDLLNAATSKAYRS